MARAKQSEGRDAYGADLARIHDLGFGDFARNSAAGLLALLEGAGLAGHTVVDLGCGSGIWAAELDRAGYPVVGVDQSAAMIELARERVPRGRFQVASFLDAELPRCGAVTAQGEVLGYLFDERVGPRSQQQLFRRVFDALEPGGLFLFDVPVPHPAWPARTFAEGEDWSCTVVREVDPTGRRLTRHITTFARESGASEGGTRDDERFRRRREVHRLLLRPAADIERDLRRIGFRVSRMRGYGDQPMYPGRVAFRARRAN